MENNTSIHLQGDMPSCFNLQDAKFHLVAERFTTNLITAIINIITAPFAVVINSLIVIVAARCSYLLTPSNLFITCLAISDVLVGLTVQPSYIAFRLMENLHRATPCFVRVLYSNSFYICFGVSLMTLSAISFERLLAVCLTRTYNTAFPLRRVLKYVVVIWSLNLALAALQWLQTITDFIQLTHLVLWFVCLVVSVVTQLAILVRVRRHQRQLHPYLRTTENVRTQRDIKLTRTIFFMVALYIIFNLPVLLVTGYEAAGFQLNTYNHYSWSETFAFLNSVSNPVMFCWKNRQFRQEILAILKLKNSSSRAGRL